MTYPKYFNPKNSLKLLGLFENFLFLKNLYLNNNFPHVLMLTGKKGSGKSTLINHLMSFIFDKNNYDLDNYEINSDTSFFKQFIKDTFSNIIYLKGSEFANIKIENIRNLKIKISQSSISNEPRFIILDDVDLFNANSLNALLKAIEEPSQKNFFILINNKSKPIIDTIKSRSLEIKIILNEEMRLNIINSLVKKFNLKLIIDPKVSQLTPGYFLKFNYVSNENKIDFNDDLLKNLQILFTLYKKEKDVMYIDMTLFMTDIYFNSLSNKHFFSNEKIIEQKRFIFDNINKFFLYNLNQNAVLNSINNKMINE